MVLLRQGYGTVCSTWWQLLSQLARCVRHMYFQIEIFYAIVYDIAQAEVACDLLRVTPENPRVSVSTVFVVPVDPDQHRQPFGEATIRSIPISAQKLCKDMSTEETLRIDFDVESALEGLDDLHLDISCRTPTVSPAKRYPRLSHHHLMNGGASLCISSSEEDETALFDFLTPTTMASSNSTDYTSDEYSYDNSPVKACSQSYETVSRCNMSKWNDGIQYHIDTIVEGVEVTLLHPDAPINTSTSSAESGDVDDELNTVNSSILIQRTPLKEEEAYTMPEMTPETPACVPLCGWLCAAADTQKHICESLAVNHLVCWQSTVPPTTGKNKADLCPRRRSRRSHQLQNIRRNLQFQHPPIQQSASFQAQSSTNIATPTKPACFPGVCTRKQVTPTKPDSPEDGYGSDPETYVSSTITPLKIPRPLETFRAKSVDELFNERIPCLRHTEFQTVPVTLFLERGHISYVGATPRLCCSTTTLASNVQHILDVMELLEISKILWPSQPDHLVAADPHRCLTIRSCQGVSWTLEVLSSTPGVAEQLAGLLKLAVATLAAAVLTEQTVDRVYFYG